MKYIVFIDKVESSFSIENKKYSDIEANKKLAELQERDADEDNYSAKIISEKPTTEELISCISESDDLFHNLILDHLRELKPWKEKSIDASNIHKIEWDDNNLIIHFTNAKYQYFDIPAKISVELGNAESPGAYLHQNIKGKYRYSKVD
jgi:hypothetical protein